MWGGNILSIQVTDITDTITVIMDTASTDGETVTRTTTKCKDSSKSTTPEDGNRTTTRDFNKMFRWSSRDMTETIRDNLKANNSSWPTEICAFPWAWLLPTTNRRFSRLLSSVTRTEMVA